MSLPVASPPHLFLATLHAVVARAWPWLIVAITTLAFVGMVLITRTPEVLLAWAWAASVASAIGFERARELVGRDMGRFEPVDADGLSAADLYPPASTTATHPNIRILPIALFVATCTGASLALAQSTDPVGQAGAVTMTMLSTFAHALAIHDWWLAFSISLPAWPVLVAYLTQRFSDKPLLHTSWFLPVVQVILSAAGAGAHSYATGVSAEATAHIFGNALAGSLIGWFAVQLQSPRKVPVPVIGQSVAPVQPNVIAGA